MKIRVILGVLLWGFLNMAMGQVNSYHLLPNARTYMYQLSDSAAVEWVENRKSKIRTESLVFPPVDTFLGPYMLDTLITQLSPGYYVLEHEVGQNIFYRAAHFSELQVIAFSQATEGSLLIRHPAYSADSIQVFFRNDPLKYDPEFGTYRLPMRKKGLLCIQTPEETAYYFWRGNRRKKVVYLSHYLTLNTVKSQGWKTSKNYNSTSYLAINQPVFQPGDTIKLKAFLTAKEGVNYTEPVALAVIDERSYRTRTLDTVYPQSPGIYVYEYPIPDSLELDKHYKIEVRPLGMHRELAENTFQYEAYELDAYRYEANMGKNQMDFTDTVRIEMRGEDATGAASTDALIAVQIELLLNSVAFAEIPESGLKIPRIVYEKELGFDSRGTASLAIPVSSLPPIQATYQVELIFRNQANELQEKELTFTVKAETEAILKQPEVSPVPPFISVKGFRKADSVFFSINNPENALLHCRLVKGKTTLSHFRLQKDSLISLGNAAGASFLLGYDIAWKGGRLEREEILPYHPKLLNVSIAQPEKIYPGQQVETRIRVTDSEGQPVPGLDLTAWGINAQFPTENLPELKLADPKNPLKWRKYRGDFGNRGSGFTTKSLRGKELLRFGLEDSIRYRLFFPDTLEQIYLPVGQAESQVAPYVYKEGRRETIFLIWIDDRLVYYYDTDMEVPYSFAASPGKHTIRIRTKEDEYTLSNVELREGYKLELSFPPTHFSTSITKAYVGPRMLPREAAALNASMVWLAPNWEYEDDVWLWQENRKYRINEALFFQRKRTLNQGLRLAGPFSAESIGFAIAGEYKMNIKRSWGRAYLLTRGQVYQEPLQEVFQPGTEWVNRYENIPEPGDLLMDEKEWKYLLSQKDQLPYSKWISEPERSGEVGDLRLFVNHQFGVESVMLQKLEDLQNVWIKRDVKPDHEQFLALAPGTYRLLLRNRSGAIAMIDSIQIEAGNMHFLKAMDLTFERTPQLIDFFSATQRSVHTPSGLRFYNETHDGGIATISGKLLETHEMPIRGAEVLLMRGFQQLAGSQTDSVGHFEFSGIEPGNYQLMVIHPQTGIRQSIIETSPDLVTLKIPLLEATIPEIAFLLQHDHGFSAYRNKEKTGIRVTCEVPDTATTDAFLIPSWQQLNPSEKATIRYLFERETDTAGFRLIKFTQVSGSIFDSQTGLPIKGSGRIRTGGQKLSFSTNSEGRFTGSVRQEADTDTLILSLPGYYSLSLSLPLEDVQLIIQKNTANAYWKRMARQNRMKAKRRFLAFNYFSGGTAPPKPPSGMQSRRFRKGKGHYGDYTGGFDRRVSQDAYSYTIASEYQTLAKSKPPRGQESLWWTNPLTEVYSNAVDSRGLAEALSRYGDQDGVPDLYDKEPNSPQGRLVDAWGVKSGYIALGDYYFNKNQEIALLGTLSGLMRSNFHDCAFWEPTLTTDSNGEAVFTTTFPEDITTWKTFVVAMNAQHQVGFERNQVKAAPPLAAALGLPRFMLAGDSVSVRGMGRNYTGEKVAVKSRFQQADRVLTQTDTLIETSLLEQAIVTTTDTGDLNISYELALKNGYRDGERRKIPVLPVGDRETTGSFHYLEGDTSLTLAVDPANGPLEIQLAQSGWEQMLVELESLKQYPHACTEQISSKLLAFVMEREAFKAMGREWEGGKNLNRLVRQLERRQLKDGTWAWWGKGETDHWMTAYATYALHRADPGNLACRRGKKALLYLSPSQLSQPGKTLRIALWMAEMEAPAGYEYWVDEVGQQGELYGKLLRERIRQLQKLPIDISSLLAEGESDALGGMYWGEAGWRWNGNRTEMTLLAYDILKTAGGFEVELAKIRQFLLMRAPRSRNTIESANVLTHLLPDMWGKSARDSASIKMKFGKQMMNIHEFPATFSPESFPGDSIRFIKKGTSAAFLSVSQGKYHPEPLPVDSLFRLKTHFVQGGKSVEILQAGEKAELIVTVETSVHSDYLNLEIPIPAACSYGDKPQPSGEAHREYEQHRTLIYLRQLSPGSHRFRIPLEVRYSGVYTINPPRVELMYAPKYMGRGEITRIRISK